MAVGYFDDDSMLRRVHRERALALAGPRALPMQAAHPLAVAGLLAHTPLSTIPTSRTESEPSRSLVYIQAIFRSFSSTWLAVIVPVQ